MDFAGSNREKIENRINELEKTGEKQGIDGEVRKDLIELTEKGKMVRGSLIIETGTAMGADIEELLDVAAAIEIIHTGLLIQDDVFDLDEERRGVKALHKQYEGLENISGEAARNLAICAGDISFFIGMQLLSKSERPEVFALFGEVFENVGYGQMTDIRSSDGGKVLTGEYIIDFYRKKTATYTFALPLKIAGLIAGKEDQQNLEEIGLEMGVLYQIKDDEIDFQDMGKNGKPPLSDIKEGKNTLHLSELAEDVGSEKIESRIEEDITQEQADWIYEKMKENEIIGKVQTLMEERRNRLEDKISDQIENTEVQDLLLETTEFIVERER